MAGTLKYRLLDHRSKKGAFRAQKATFRALERKCQKICAMLYLQLRRGKGNAQEPRR